MFDDNSGLSAAVQTVAESLKTLRQLGRNDDAQQILTDASRSYDDITNDPSRSDAWKVQTAAARYISVMTSVAAKLRRLAETASTQLADDKARVYGIAGLKGDYASLQIALRDAITRVNDIGFGDTTTIPRLLASAVDHGDETLAHAVVEVAVRNGDADTVTAFEAAFPHLSDAVERLWDFTHGRPTAAGLVTAMQSGVLKPAILARLQDYEIEAAAAGNANVGRWNVGA